MDVKKKQPRTGPKDPWKKTVPTAGKVVIDLFEQWRRKNPRIPESNASHHVGKARVTKLVKVVTDQTELESVTSG